jgi:hemolysin III
LRRRSYHAAFQLERLQQLGLRHALHIADQCAIYLLIAGSYTPFLVLLFYGKDARWCHGMLTYIWGACGGGIALELLCHTARAPPAAPWIKYTTIVIYLLMGWSVAFPPLL